MKWSDVGAAYGFLFTDQYQLTMSQLYYRMGLHERPARFEYFFRKYPDYDTHKAGYCIFAGLEWLLDWMNEARCTREDIERLRGQKGAAGQRLFADDYLDWLYESGSFDCMNLWATPEGRVVHPNVPLTVAEGPLGIAQILETPLLNKLNYQTLIASKASRICDVGRDQPLLEFGMRRAQESGAHAGARAALIGGAHFTSNAGISHILGYPPKGTHAHSMVQLFMAMGEGEQAAFQAYADVYPDDCLLLVDTVDTLQSGIPNAIKVFEDLKRKGHKPVGIRLDSGDLAHLAIQAARMLNDAGFEDARIVLSNELDEMVILQIIDQIETEASSYGVDPDSLIKRLIYGVGTKLITSEGKPSLDGVYKLVAVRQQGEWTPAIKMSETVNKTLNPGEKHVWRLYDERGKATADLLSLHEEDVREMNEVMLRHPADESKRRTLRREQISEIELLLKQVLDDGKRIDRQPTIEDMRAHRQRDVERLDPGVRRIINPHMYHVSLTQRLRELKRDLLEKWKPEG